MIYLNIISLLFLFQVRDYIHVIDLADGHIAALRKLDDLKISKFYLLSSCLFLLFIMICDGI